MNDSRRKDQIVAKVIVLRLSSLGDIVLATSFLHALHDSDNKGKSILSDTVEIDWVIFSQFAELLEGHPLISNLHRFQRKSGLSGLISWVRFAADLHSAMVAVNSDSRIIIADLHNNLRTRLFRCIWWVLNFRRPRPQLPKLMRSEVVEKQRIKLWSLFVLKGFGPRDWPKQWIDRHKEVAVKVIRRLNRDYSNQRFVPSFKHWVTDGSSQNQPSTASDLFHFAVIPDSACVGKQWATANFISLAADFGEQFQRRFPSRSIFISFFGKNRSGFEGAAEEFYRIAERKSLDASRLKFTNRIGETNLKEVAVCLAGSDLVLSNDSGLAHLAQALEVPTFVIFGPTRPSVGFSPWGKNSQSIYSDVVCSPCSKDGKFCYRIGQEFWCLEQVTVEMVLRRLLLFVDQKQEMDVSRS